MSSSPIPPNRVPHPRRVLVFAARVGRPIGWGPNSGTTTRLQKAGRGEVVYPGCRSIRQRDGGFACQALADVFAQPVGEAAFASDRRIHEHDGGVIALGIEESIGAISTGSAV